MVRRRCRQQFDFLPDVTERWARAQIIQITQADLESVNAHASTSSTKDTMHEGFVTEARSRRLARKRQRRRNDLLSDSSSESDVPGNSTLPPERPSARSGHTSSTPTRDHKQLLWMNVSKLAQKTMTLSLNHQRYSHLCMFQSARTWQTLGETVAKEKSVPASCERAARNEATTTIPKPATLQSSVNVADPQEGTVAHDKSIPAICDRAGRNEESTTIPEPRTIQSSVNVEVPQEETVAYDKTMPAICNRAGTNEPSTSTGITHQIEPCNIDPDTPTQWTSNDRQYMRKVAHLLEFDLGKHLQKGHGHSFTERVRQAKLMRVFRERNIWTKADPEIDAWMLATGRKPDVFDIKAFVDHEPDVLPHLARLRKKLNVMVLTSRCPVARVLKAKGNPAGEEEQEEVPSQTFWTTVKKWFH